MEPVAARLPPACSVGAVLLCETVNDSCAGVVAFCSALMSAIPELSIAEDHTSRTVPRAGTGTRRDHVVEVAPGLARVAALLNGPGSHAASDELHQVPR